MEDEQCKPIHTKGITTAKVPSLTPIYLRRYHLRFRRQPDFRLSYLCLSPYLTS